MLKKTIFEIPLPYRENMRITAFLFGQTEDGRILGVDAGEEDLDSFEKSIAFVAGMRGNEVQQTFICSQLVHKLRKIEARGDITPGKLVVVVPCVNPPSMNVGKRFWMGDNTDVNRMMPGYNLGETTQRIADGVFSAGQGFKYGVHFSSYYLEGNFLPHVRIMRCEDGNMEDNGEAFGLPYITRHIPGSFDTTTLHYNWRLWDTEAYTLYTMETDVIDTESADVMVRACLRFMDAQGIIYHPCHQGMRSTEFSEHLLVAVHAECGGFFIPEAKLGDLVAADEEIARIIDPLSGEVKGVVRAPQGGVVFFVCSTPTVYEGTMAFEIVPRDVNEHAEDEPRGNFLDPEA